MTRELKLALIVGFSLVLVVTVLISDHLSKARHLALAGVNTNTPVTMPVSQPDIPLPVMVADSREAAPAPIEEPSAAAAPQPQDQPAEIKQHPVWGDTGRVARADAEQARPALPTPPVREVPETAAAERVHVVAEGETLYQISKKYYGGSGSWQKIAQANGVKPEAVKVGMKLRLPGLAVAEAPAPSAKKPAPGRSQDAVTSNVFKTYAVRPGDTLQGISRRMLGSPGRVAELMRLNNIDDGDVLPEGAMLKLPNS